MFRVTLNEEAMKFICLGYAEPGKWESLSESQRESTVEECFTYDDTLKQNGNFIRGEALQSARSAKTLRWRNGKVSVIDGPYAETKEQIGGILVLEARDLDHAVELMSRHPGLRHGGPFEIRPVDEEFTARANDTKPSTVRVHQSQRKG